MPVITSSNRSPAQWATYIERNQRTSLERLMSDRPESPTRDAVLAAGIRPPSPAPDPFDHVIAVDELGAPIWSTSAPDDLFACENGAS